MQFLDQWIRTHKGRVCPNKSEIDYLVSVSGTTWDFVTGLLAKRRREVLLEKEEETETESSVYVCLPEECCAC